MILIKNIVQEQEQNGMQTSVLIIDDFYNNPHEVRNYALSLPFDVKGNYPGGRTKSVLDDGMKDFLQQLIEPHAGKITNWCHKDGLTGSFQLTFSHDRSWIHSDVFNKWAGVLYLTPDAPLSGGTALYKYKKTGEYGITHLDDQNLYEAYDYTKWELVDRIGNKFNRLVLYRGNFFHASLDYFGDKPENARLFQLFFISTEF